MCHKSLNFTFTCFISLLCVQFKQRQAQENLRAMLLQPLVTDSVEVRFSTRGFERTPSAPETRCCLLAIKTLLSQLVKFSNRILKHRNSFKIFSASRLQLTNPKRCNKLGNTSISGSHAASHYHVFQQRV